jgi:hypothetical protein
MQIQMKEREEEMVRGSTLNTWLRTQEKKDFFLPFFVVMIPISSRI